MNRIHLIIASSMIYFSLQGMEVPYRECPDFSISNGSQNFIVTGTLYREVKRVIHAEPLNLMPDQNTNSQYISRASEGVLAQIHSGIARYSIEATWGSLRLFLGLPPQKVAQDGKILWKEPKIEVQEIPFRDIKALVIALIKEDGHTVLRVPGYVPMDGRPAVSLDVYEAVTGHRCYCTPYLLLGLFSQIDPSIIRVAYKMRLEQLDNDKTKYKEEYTQLLTWAGNKLLAECAKP